MTEIRRDESIMLLTLSKDVFTNQSQLIQFNSLTSDVKFLILEKSFVFPFARQVSETIC